jgi:Cu/Ag efflux pump CusA
MNALIKAALSQRLLMVVIAFALVGFGLRASMKLSVDAFPDVTNVQVQVATEAPGRTPEEVERFVTVPVEIGMTGLPGLTEMRSLNRNGLSIVTLVFTDSTDVYFARQLVMERLMEERRLNQVELGQHETSIKTPQIVVDPSGRVKHVGFITRPDGSKTKVEIEKVEGE